MTRFILFLFPALLDVVFGGSRFVCLQRMANSDETSNANVALILTWWAIGYIIGSKSCGFFVTARNSARLLVSSSIALGVVSLALIHFEQLGAMYPIMFVFGICMSMFFVPFQVFMRSVGSDEGSSLAKSMSLYTGSWSLGIAMGPFLGGFLWQQINWQSCHVLSALVSFGSAVGIYFFAKAHQHCHEPVIAEEDTKKTGNPYIKMPDMAIYGWIFCSVGFIAMLMLLGVVPKLMESLGLSSSYKGVIIAQLNMTQSLMAFSMIRGRVWMYKPWAIMLMGSCGAASLAGFALSTNETGLLVSSSMFGIYAAMFCMCFVFYSLVHPTKSAKYLSMNETIVGFNHITGPLIGGFIADLLGFRSVFILAGALIAAAVLGHAVVLKIRCGKFLPTLQVEK